MPSFGEEGDSVEFEVITGEWKMCRKWGAVEKSPTGK